MTAYEEIAVLLRSRPRTWLVTGVAGFIGSNLLQALLDLGQTVVGLDNFSTGYQRNLDEVRQAVDERSWSRFTFHEGDIRDLATCHEVCHAVDVVLHQAALGSVPRSIADPITTNETNIDGFLNLLVAARDAGVRRFVYAASSSTYGDEPTLPKVEERIGRPLSPYAVTKYVNELYAHVFQSTYGIDCVGLRYFNVFGKRQDPAGAYAAVIPKWIATLLEGGSCSINGDGETSRDFCFIANVVQANILAATVDTARPDAEVYNVACGDRTTLNDLFTAIRDGLAASDPDIASAQPDYQPFRQGDVRHSQADISKIRTLLHYRPTHSLREGLEAALPWYVEQSLPAAVVPRG